MVMETTLRAKNINDDVLRTLGTQIYTLLGETSLGIKCTLKNNRLVVLGEHAADTSLDSASILDRLERNIQALQLQFTQHVRLYLRQMGQRQPYAYRQFVLAPPPPPGLTTHKAAVLDEKHALDEAIATPEENFSDRPSDASVLKADSVPQEANVATSDVSRQDSETTPQSAIDEQPWIVGDAELDALVNQLTAVDPLANWDIQSQDDVDNAIAPSSLSSLEVEDSGDGGVHPMEHQDRLASSGAMSHREILTDDAGDRADALGDQGQQSLLEDGLIPNATELALSLPTDSPTEEDILNQDDAGLQGVNGAERSPDLSVGSVAQSMANMSASAYQEPALTHVEELCVESPLVTSSGDDDASSIVVSDSKELAQPTFHSFTYETSQRLKELSHSILHSRPKAGIEKSEPQQPPATAHLENHGHRRMAIATMGLASLGFAAGIYGATRPCVIGNCNALQTADQLGDKSQRLMQQAKTWTDIEAAAPPLHQALEILEPIPVWSSHSGVAQQKMDDYTLHLGQINQLLDVEQAVQHANQLSSQSVYSIEDLQTMRSLWQSAIDDLERLPLDSPLHGFAQEHLVDYLPQLANADQKIETEEAARVILETAQEAAQLAQVRQGVAQNLENWQFARVTWLVAINRLKQLENETLAAQEAERLLAFYQRSLEDVNRHVDREQVAAKAFEKAEKHAQMAAAAESRHDWQQAIADWNHAIQNSQQIDNGSTYYLKAEKRRGHYEDSLVQVQEKLKAKTLIEGELKQSCLGELQLCHIVSIDQSIKLQLDESYMDAISTARGNGNYNLQAVVTDHQLMVRQSLDRIANSFDLPIEVYNPDGGLLERHIPKPR